MGIDHEKTFGFKPESIGNRYRHHWVITEPDEDDERAGAKAGCLCVRARDGASNPVDAEACKHPNFIGTVEDYFDRTFRYYYYRPLTDADREDPAATITALRKRVEELEAETVRRGKALVRLRDKLINICDGLEDQGDLVALRSTNDADDFREAVRELDNFKWGLILAEDDNLARAVLRAKGGGNGERDTSIEDHGGLIEARSVATGEAPAARIHVNGHAYVPATTHAATLAELREAATDTLASLVAAVSLLERGGKRAAPSDKMFHTMLADYNASIKRARAALARIKEAT